MNKIPQDIFPTEFESAPQTIPVHNLKLHDASTVLSHIRNDDECAIGVSLRLAKDGAIDIVAFATKTDIFCITLSAAKKKSATQRRDDEAMARLLCNSSRTLVGFGMARLALLLHRHFATQVRGVDLSTLFSSKDAPWSPAEFASKRVCPLVRMRTIHALWYHNEVRDVCLRAWLSAFLAEQCEFHLDSAPEVNTDNLNAEELRCLEDQVTNIELLEVEKPTYTDGDMENFVEIDGQIVIRNARYNTRVRRSKQTTVVFEMECGKQVVGQAVRAEGKETGVKITQGGFRGGVTAIKSVRVVGREEQTNAERARDAFVLRALQGAFTSLAESPFVKMLWFPDPTPRDRGAARRASVSPRIDDDQEDEGEGFSDVFNGLNASQKGVVRAMWSTEQPLVVAHGPPGTGKTSTIAASLEGQKATWVIAQSNVGVKNIARTLAKDKYRIDFKILVSKEFYVEWHEHLYEEIHQRLIRSDDLFDDKVATERLLGGSSIILCTVSMLSNPALDECGVYDLVPVEHLVVDEASQIDCFEFMHLFHKFKTLEKVCMFGDPKQLPPYGKETAPGMKTIFDFVHLKPFAHFLNTQYRMPTPLGEFISEAVYNSKLKSYPDHEVQAPSCIRFIDVRKGFEESMGSSWQNTEEVHAIVNIVKNYYRYHKFCIITPYDAQRSAITSRLKAENLPWDSVYNVDSFQGHEAPYVIVSVVRTSAAGFLRSLNRMNVMLTRCERGMVIVTNRRFLTGAGAGVNTLLGRLAQRWAGYGDAWVDYLALSGAQAALPGAPGRGGGMGGATGVEHWRRDNVGPTTGAELWTAHAGAAAPRSLARVRGSWQRPSSMLHVPRGVGQTSLKDKAVASLGAAGVRPRGGNDVLADLGSDSFPELPCEEPPWRKTAMPAVRGRWMKGSEACKL